MMYRLSHTQLASVCLLVVVILALMLDSIDTQKIVSDAKTTGAVYPYKRVLRYGFTVQNTTNRFLKQAEVRIFAPVKHTSFQQSKSISATYDHVIEIDSLGNQQLVFKLDMPPLATKIVSITAELALAETSNPMEMPEGDIYTGPARYIETGHQAIRSLSEQLGGADALQASKKAFDWVSSNISYAGYIEDDRGALYALDHRRGDCTEFMYLYTALARLKNIPTRGLGGFVVSEDSVLKARDFHNWAEIYIDGRWRVVDPQNKKYMQSEADYIVLKILSDQQVSENRRNSNTNRIAFADRELNIQMN